MDITIKTQEGTVYGRLVRLTGKVVIVKVAGGKEQYVRDFLETEYFKEAKAALIRMLKQKQFIMNAIASDFDRYQTARDLRKRVEYVSKLKGFMSLIYQNEEKLLSLLPKPSSKFYQHDSQIVFEILSSARDYMGKSPQIIAS